MKPQIFVVEVFSQDVDVDEVGMIVQQGLRKNYGFVMVGYSTMKHFFLRPFRNFMFRWFGIDVYEW